MFAFLMIGRLMQVPVSMVSVYPMFVIATLIGMLTMVPGGMGTFDVLMILGLSQLGLIDHKRSSGCCIIVCFIM